jgi:hypothetical protein
VSGARVATDRIVAWTVAFAAALAFAGFDRTISRAQAATPAPCTATGIGEAAALQLDGNAPIVAGRNGVVAVYESFLADSRFQAPAKSPQLYCTGASGVVGIAAYLGILYVADARTVHVLDADTGEPKGSFAPALAPNEAIAAIALLPGGDVELALASAAIGSDARQPVTTRFVIYAKPVNASGLAPLRTFTCDSFLAPVSAIASDTKGRTYAYDDGGEMLIFRAGATGATKPTTRFSGTASALRPAARSSARGSRQMALDILGSLYAADDGSIVRFGVADDGQNAQSDFMAYDPPSHLGIVRGLATDNESNLYVLSINPRTAAAAIRVYRRIGHALALSVTLP